MARIQRALPPFHAAYGMAGPHMIGETAVEFDADGYATVDDPAVLEALQQWPETFLVMEEPPPPTPRAEGVEHATPAPGYTAEGLDSLTFRELQDLAATLGESNVFRRTKRDLIEAILERQSKE